MFSIIINQTCDNRFATFTLFASNCVSSHFRITWELFFLISRSLHSLNVAPMKSTPAIKRLSAFFHTAEPLQVNFPYVHSLNSLMKSSWVQVELLHLLCVAHSSSRGKRCQDHCFDKERIHAVSWGHCACIIYAAFEYSCCRTICAGELSRCARSKSVSVMFICSSIELGTLWYVGVSPYTPAHQLLFNAIPGCLLNLMKHPVKREIRLFWLNGLKGSFFFCTNTRDDSNLWVLAVVELKTHYSEACMWWEAISSILINILVIRYDFNFPPYFIRWFNYVLTLGNYN